MKRVISVVLALLVLSASVIQPSVLVFADDPVVIGIEVKSQPKLQYYIGEPLDLTDLSVILERSNNASIDGVGFEDFIYMGITTDLENGAILTAEHNNRSIKVMCNGYETETAPLSVTSPPVDGVTLDPDTAVFNKNPAFITDITVEIQWWNQALEITGIKKGDTPLQPADFSVSENEGKDILTIKKEYLASQPTGTITLTVMFTENINADLVIDIQETLSQPPYWPDGTTFSTPSKPLPPSH